MKHKLKASLKGKFLNSNVIEVNLQRGQTLITLLFFVVIAVTITSAAVIVIFSNNLAADKTMQGDESYYVAESGIENAILRFLRNPSYTGESNLAVGTGTVTTTITGSGPYTITSVGTQGNYQRTIQVTIDYTNSILTVTSWKEL